MNEDEIKKLLEENKKMNEETLELTRYIKRFVIFQQVFGVIKILIILIPVILGIIYLPPILKEVFKQYQQILDFSQVETLEARPESTSMAAGPDPVLFADTAHYVKPG